MTVVDVSDEGWVCVVDAFGDVHVAPTVDGATPARGHLLERDCWCHPDVLRDSPLDDAVWSHRDPTWPGARARVEA